MGSVMPPTHNRSVFLTLPEIHSDWSRDPSHGSQEDGSADSSVVLTVRKMSYEVTLRVRQREWVMTQTSFSLFDMIRIPSRVS